MVDEKFKKQLAGSRIKGILNISQRIAKFQQRRTSYNPSAQQRFFKARAKFRRGVGTVYPQAGSPKRYQGRTGQRGRGRPKNTFKYVIPGKGNVSVFEYRAWLQGQKQFYKMQLQQQMAKYKIERKYGQVQMPQDQSQQIQMPQQQVQQYPQQFSPYQQFQKPQFAGQSVMPVEPQPFKEISVLERTPLNMSGNTLQPMRETYEETDLMTGQTKLKLRTGGFL